MSDPYGPTDPSRPPSGENDPTSPLGPSQGYPSQPQPYGQPGFPPPPPGGAYQQAAPYPSAAPVAPPRKKSRRGLWITLGVVLVLLIACVGGGLYAFGQYLAPAVAAGVFCGELRVQNYPTAYKQLDKNLQGQFTQEQFVQGAQQLDQTEGNVTACTASQSGNSYHYSLGSSTASATVVLTRATAGSLTGTVHLKNESGWKVDGLDTSLLGVNLGALKTAGAFCAALQSQDYTTAYGLLGSQLQSAASAADFALASQAHDQIDGTVSACGLAGLGQGNSDTGAALVVGITRAKLGAKQGPVTLDVEQGAWKVTAIDAGLQGTDIGPLETAAKLCADLISGNLADAYQNLTSSGLRSNVSQADFTAFFALNAGQAYTGCTPNYTTYTISATKASFDATFMISSSSGPLEATATTYWVPENGTWKLDDINLKS